MKTIAVVCLLIALCSCASMGVEVRPDQVATFQKGVSTYSDVVAKLGQPTNIITRGDGSKIVMYGSAHSQVRPETLIPIVGMFVGGADVRSNAVVFTFSPDGTLVSYTTSESKMGVGTGFIGGGAYQERTDQPRDATQAEPARQEGE